MKIISWNVNGIRAAYKKGLDGFVRTAKPDILCLQETKAHPEQLPPEILELVGMKSEWAYAQKKGYSGVATFWRDNIKESRVGLGLEEFDSEGRVVITDHEKFILFNIYFPNGQKGADRQDYKLKFHHALNDYLLDQIEQRREIIVVGDYNVAPTEIDVYDTSRFVSTSGFLPAEREWYEKFLTLGFIDSFRHFNPDARNRYTWWNQIERGRLSNRGWRIDMICITNGLLPKLKSAEILDNIEGSDHCPVSVELDL